jgi:NMD protein affecting ribosome stability and mRNA decay
MFGFMLDETETPDRVNTASCQTCHLRLAPRAPRVVLGDATYHRECYEAAHRKRTGKRPTLVLAPAAQGDRLTFRPAA